MDCTVSVITGLGRGSVVQVAIDRHNAILFTRAIGFLGAEEVVDIFSKIDDVVRGMGLPGEEHCKLIDLSEAKVAPSYTIDLLRAVIAKPEREPVYARRVAYFGASPLLALQVSRVCRLRPGLALFDDRASAYQWLREPTYTKRRQPLD